MSRLKVTCAIIEIDDKVLVVQRSEKMKHPLKWELPGGKIENGESEEECLVREIFEELNLTIRLENKLSTVLYDYPNISIELIPFVTKIIRGDLILKEHKTFTIINKNQLKKLDWTEADIPIINEYLNL